MRYFHELAPPSVGGHFVDARAHAHVLGAPTFAMHLAFTTSLTPLRARDPVRRVAKIKKNVSASRFAFEAGRQYQAERLSRSIDEDDWDALDTRRGSTSHLSTPRQARYADATPSEKREPSYRSSRSGGDPSSSAVSRRSAPKTLFSIRNKRVEEARARAEKSSAENPASASAPETRDSYAWAREDQARNLAASSSKRRSTPLITRYADAISSRDPYFDWAYDDQRVEVVNRTLETALASASAECVVEWITETAWTSGDPRVRERRGRRHRVVATHGPLRSFGCRSRTHRRGWRERREASTRVVRGTRRGAQRQSARRRRRRNLRRGTTGKSRARMGRELNRRPCIGRASRVTCDGR